MTPTMVPRPPAPRIYACQDWGTNGELIRDAVLGRVDLANDLCIDPTFESGLWWTEVRPDHLVTYHRDVDGSDFRDLPHADNEFHHSFLDAPYVAEGGRATSTIKDFNDRYGLDDAPKTPDELQDMINDGLAEQARIVRPGGFIFAKCMNYVSNNELRLGVFSTIAHGLSIGLTVEDWYVMKGHPGPQPKLSTCCWCGEPIRLSSKSRGRVWNRMVRTPGFDNGTCLASPVRGHDPDGSNRQNHAAQNASHLIVFRVP